MQLQTKTKQSIPPAGESCCPILELRQYTLHPGQRDVLIELFDREFIETQEVLGMSAIGQFRDMDDPDHFVWLRGFQDMRSRARGLKAFYTGPVWKAHRDVANATMIDSDDVLLLHPVRPRSGFSLGRMHRNPPGSTSLPEGLCLATTYYFDAPDEGFAGFFERSIRPQVTQAGATVLGCFETEHSSNNYPDLPIREGVQVFAWFAIFKSYAAYQFYAAALAGSQEWRRAAMELTDRITGRPEELRLTPTARSRLHA